MNFLKYFCLLPSAFCLLLLAGCEWTSGGGADTWNDRENFVDFSGAYKAADGGVLVRSPGSTSGATTNIINSVTGELLGAGDGTNTFFSGVLAHPTLIRGSLTIIVGGYQFNDTPGTTAGTVALTVTPSDGSAGIINYNTGMWALSFPAPIADGTQILATYQYLVTTILVAQGNHGDPIYSFVLFQQGNTIQVLDDAGSTYEGYIGSVRTTGGYPIDLDPSRQQAAPITGPVVAQFYATGSSQGYTVHIAGVLQGTLTAQGSTLANRTMQATFVEEGGYDADINGTAP